VCKIFPDGNLFIITAYWANNEQVEFYNNKSEVIRNEED